MFLVVGKNAWGRGIDEKSAVRAMRKNAARENKNTFIVYRVDDPNVSVDYMGHIVSTAKPVELKRVGFKEQKYEHKHPH